MDKIPVKAISVTEARQRLSKLKPFLTKLKKLYVELVELENELSMIKSDEDLGNLLNARKNMTMKEDELIDIQDKFRENDCVIKDAGTGLIDFIGIRKGKAVWLCFQEGEEELSYFHEWNAGYTGRKRIDFH
ncbi:MAG: hypothetical protein HeimC2_25130 [Candidatus Heimdallarchaeota archaeon LC_2]|nr:MAG: hypothetical protein HeimC2_25130 [Candidatus Heimdallarchaeota archaeon LC_2]